jgi:monooxygenase
MSEHFDVLVVGAGISGISAGYHLQTECPNKSYAILEGRAAIGGTWDLFQYPGVRSDSDMFTLGYYWQPWLEAKAIADGPSILAYLKRTASQHGIDKRIRYNHRVKRAFWDSARALWTVDVERGENAEIAEYTCNFLFMCSGYYDYDKGYTPEYTDIDTFKGPIIHPQKWTPDIDYANKKVVVIGSGATAVTLVPEMAKKAAHVTMLQRSPTYYVTMPAENGFANLVRRLLPEKMAHSIIRWKQVLVGSFFYGICRKYPKAMATLLIKGVRKELGDTYDVATHFTPKYNPWDQRLCLVPDSDFFKSITAGKSSIVTDHIERFTEQGILLKSGKLLEADMIISATGLNVMALGKMEVHVDGKRIDMSKTLGYKGMMYTDIPNLATSFGYTNASWTLKADLTCNYVCRLLNHMTKTGTSIATPILKDPSVTPEPWVDFTSTYFQRSLSDFPKQGSKTPWKLHQNYMRDVMLLKINTVDDGAMIFSVPQKPATLSIAAE